MTPREIIETLGLSPHPEGGWYREMWRAEAKDDERAAGTAIYLLYSFNRNYIINSLFTFATPCLRFVSRNLGAPLSNGR